VSLILKYLKEEKRSELNKINILPENIANKIAAGEVVQRPESVVKELLENSIDAGATSIELIIRKAGKSLIQVCDNGCGMSEDDAILCLQKHATSKISTYEDLEAIMTLGFRGEALSAISAVSLLEIKTERPEDEIGTYIRLDEPGTIIKEKGSFPKGTIISIKNLFFNTPGRRNFLKSDATELKHIIDTFNKIALSKPEISFKLYVDNDVVYDYKEGSIENRIKEVFAENMFDALIPVGENTDFIKLNGYIGKPSLLKKNKGEQYLFLNKRFVISKQINHAVFTAYENFLEKGDYPFFILFLDIDPAKIDVNVHPTKLEVRFEDEKDVYNFVLAVIRKGLGSVDLVPSMTFRNPIFSPEESTEKLAVNKFSRTETNDFTDRPDYAKKSYAAADFSDKEIDLIFNTLPEMPKNTQARPDIPFEKPMTQILHQENRQPELFNRREVESFIIQLHNKYILSQIKTGLMIIDQHVAHERILYEKALKLYDADLRFSQPVLFPITIELDPAKFGLVKELNDYLNRIGFMIKFFSKNTIIIEGIPEDVKLGTEEKIFMEILDEYAYNQKEKKLEVLDNIAKSFSCKTAIKAGDYLSEKEMRNLIDQLFATSNPYVCPHGRPIVIKISLEEFDRRFGRTS